MQPRWTGRLPDGTAIFSTLSFPEPGTSNVQRFMAKQDFLAGSDAPSLVIKPRRLKPVALRKVWWIAVAVIGLCVVSGMAYEAFATYRHRMIPAPGKLVAVGGYRLYIDCRGQGSPTVVIESGLGDASDVWQDLLPKFSAMSRTCAYDRAGLGRSENGPLPRSAEQIAKELRAWLRHSGEAGPHILVAHSTGRYPVRVFAKEYPNEVAGLLLLDVSHPVRISESPQRRTKTATISW